MKQYLARLSKASREMVEVVSLAADKLNTRVYLVGGCVRDLLRGSSTNDLDFSAEKDGIALAEAVAKRLGARLVRHERFATATVVRGDRKIDIATVRKESYPHPGQLPVIAPGTLAEDLYRRDFTINAMAIDVTRPHTGALIDLYGGQADLEAGLVRVLQERSFIDDPTRILRAVRFEQRYRFRIEPRTLRLLREAVRRRMLLKVSPHRIRDELMLALSEEKPCRVLERLDARAGLRFLSGRLRLSPKTTTLLRNIERQIAWFERAYPRRPSVRRRLVYLIGLCAPLSGSDAASLVRKLGLGTEAGRTISSYKSAEKGLSRSLGRQTVSPSGVYRLCAPLSDEVLLAVRAASPEGRIRSRIAAYFGISCGMRTTVRGEDIRSLGVEPGPIYKILMQKVLDARIDGKLHSRAEELEFIRQCVRVRGRP